MLVRRAALLAALLSAVAASPPAHAQSPRPDQLAFREIFKELVETNTTLSAGSCTLAAERMAARLKAAGYAAADVEVLATAEKLGRGASRPSSRAPIPRRARFSCSATSTWWRRAGKTGRGTRSR
jgi:hypothetical protein